MIPQMSSEAQENGLPWLCNTPTGTGFQFHSIRARSSEISTKRGTDGCKTIIERFQQWFYRSSFLELILVEANGRILCALPARTLRCRPVLVVRNCRGRLFLGHFVWPRRIWFSRPCSNVVFLSARSEGCHAPCSCDNWSGLTLDSAFVAGSVS